MLNERTRPRNVDEARQEARKLALLMGEDYVLRTDPSQIRGCYPDDMVDALAEYQAALAKVRLVWNFGEDKQE